MCKLENSVQCEVDKCSMGASFQHHFSVLHDLGKIILGTSADAFVLHYYPLFLNVQSYFEMTVSNIFFYFFFVSIYSIFMMFESLALFTECLALF